MIVIVQVPTIYVPKDVTCTRICSNHPCILGAGHSNLPKILAIMAEALNCGVLDDETKGICEAMSTIIKQIRVLIVLCATQFVCSSTNLLACLLSVLDVWRYLVCLFRTAD